MQDKEMLEQLADRGWARMQVTLDREMPHRKRRPLLWLCLIAVGLVAISGTVFYFGQTRRPEHKPVVTQPIAINEGKSQPGKTPVAGQQKTDPETPASSVDLTLPKTGLSLNAFDASKNQIRATQVSSGPDGESGRPEYRSPAAENNPVSAIPVPLEKGTPEITPPFTPDPGVAVYRRPEFPAVEPLDDQTDWKGIQKPEEKPEFKTIPVRNQNRRWVAEIGALYNGGYGISGYTLSAIRKIPLGNGKWSLHAGLGFRKQAIPLGLTRNFIGNSLTYDSNGTQNGTPITASYDPESLSLDQVNSSNFNAGYYVVGVIAGTKARIDATYADVALSLSHKLNARWSVETGARIGLLLPSQWKALPDSSEALQVANSKFLAASNSQEQVSAQVLSAFDLAVVGGIKYALGPQWDLGLQYHFGVNDLFLLDGVDLRNRVVRVSAGYRF